MNKRSTTPKASQASATAAKKQRPSRFADWDRNTVEVLHEGDRTDRVEIVPARPRSKAARKR